MEDDEEFDVVVLFNRDGGVAFESDFLGAMTVAEILDAYPEISRSRLEGIKAAGRGSILLNIATGDSVRLEYLG